MSVVEGEGPERPKLPIWQIVKSGYRETWRRPGALMSAAAIPFVLSVLLAGAVPVDEADSGRTLLRSFADAVPLAFFELAWLRFLLLRSPEDRPNLLPRPGRRLLPFVGYSLLLTALIVPSLLVGTIFEPQSASSTIVLQGASATLFFVAAYLGVRLQFVLVWLAIDAPGRLAASWRLSRGNGFRLLWAMMLIFAPFVIALFVFGVTLAALDHESAALFESGAFQSQYFWTNIVVELAFTYAITAVSAAALIKAFSLLTGWVGDQQSILERFE